MVLYGPDDADPIVAALEYSLCAASLERMARSEVEQDEQLRLRVEAELMRRCSAEALRDFLRSPP